MTRAFLFACSALACTALATPPARGAELPSDVQRSVQLFEQARKLIDAGNCREAVPKLEESIRYNESVGAHFSLARCAPDALGAWREYKRAEVLAERKKDERMQTARDQASALEPQLALVTIELRGEASHPDLQVLLDGRPLDPAAYRSPLAVEPGKHTFVAFAPKADRRWTKSVVAVVGRREGVVLDLLAPEPAAIAPAPVASPPPPPLRETPASSGSAQRTVGFVVGGTGVAFLVAGAVMGVVSAQTLRELEKSCSSYPECETDLSDLNRRGRTEALLSTVGFIVGGVALAGGIVLVVTAPSRPAKTALSLGPNGALFTQRW